MTKVKGTNDECDTVLFENKSIFSMKFSKIVSIENMYTNVSFIAFKL